jgi:hypothetical protein
MRHDELYVADLVDSTRAVCEYLDGISRERWDGDRVLRDAVLYRLLLLGEIASAIPDALRESAGRMIRPEAVRARPTRQALVTGGVEAEDEAGVAGAERAEELGAVADGAAAG